MINIKFKKLHENAVIPTYATPGSAGADLYSVQDLKIHPGETKLVKLGFAVAIPEGYEIQVRPRSGLALKEGITVLNSPGTVDSDYRGEMCVILHNTNMLPFDVKVGMRIAQMLVAPVIQARFDVVDELDETKRGSGGFGSSGS